MSVNSSSIDCPTVEDEYNNKVIIKRIKLPEDELTLKYTQLEVIGLAIKYGKTRVINAIDAWESGQCKRQLRSFFPVLHDTYPKETVIALLGDLNHGSRKWLQKVVMISKCKHGPSIQELCQMLVFKYDEEFFAQICRLRQPQLDNAAKTKLKLPQDTSTRKYTNLEVIELAIQYNKAVVINAIDKWGHGQSNKQLTSFFPKKGNKYPEEIVVQLLQELDKGSDGWLEKVAEISNCRDHGESVDELHQMLNYDAMESTHCHEKDAGAGSCSATNPVSQIAPNIQPPLFVECTPPEISHLPPLPPSLISPEYYVPRQGFGATYTAQVTPINQPLLAVSSSPQILHQQPSIISPDNNTCATTPFTQVNPQNLTLGASNVATGTPLLLSNDNSKKSRLHKKFAEILTVHESYCKHDTSNSLSAANLFGKLDEQANKNRLSILFDEYKEVLLGNCENTPPSESQPKHTCDSQDSAVEDLQPEDVANLPDVSLAGEGQESAVEDLRPEGVANQPDVSPASEGDDPTSVEHEPELPTEQPEHEDHGSEEPSAHTASGRDGEASESSEHGSEESQEQPERENESVVRPEIPHENLFNIHVLKEIVDALDWNATVRRTRDGTNVISLHKGKLPTENVKYLIFVLSHRVMSHSKLDAEDAKVSQQVCEYAAKLLMYDHGYKQVKGISKLTSTWGERLSNAFKGGSDTRPLQSHVRGRTKYTDKIESEHPGLLRRIFRYAQHAIGNQASFEDIARTMMKKADTDDQGNVKLKLNAFNVYRWFKQYGGKEKSPKEKPYLTEDQKLGRVEWCEDMIELMESLGEDFHAVFLDEKWFYTTSRRRALKVLPPGPGEDPDEVAPVIPTTVSRRNVIKAMYLGVVGRPIPEHDFNGKIFLKRVARDKEYMRTIHSQNFSDDAGINGLLKSGDWHKLVVDESMTIEDLRVSIAENYFLDADIQDRLVLHYKFEGMGTCKYIDEEAGHVPSQELLSLGEYTLKVRYIGRRNGNEGEKRMTDVNCDSLFMLETMPEVGKAIREAYHWVPLETPIYLFLDNAGGHGTDEAVTKYVNDLYEEHNIICKHQRPRSPATNMLDLGVWMALQNIVEKMHFRQRKEVNALARTVEEAWENALEPIKLTNVYNRWKMVLGLILEDNGGDKYVEAKRGKLFRAPPNEEEDFGNDGDVEGGPNQGEVDEMDEIEVDAP